MSPKPRYNMAVWRDGRVRVPSWIKAEVVALNDESITVATTVRIWHPGFWLAVVRTWLWGTAHDGPADG